jgi:hypothetical protein
MRRLLWNLGHATGLGLAMDWLRAPRRAAATPANHTIPEESRT